MNTLKIAIGADHAGFLLKEKITEYLKELNLQVIDCGTFSEVSCDYPDFAHPVANAIVDNKVDCGILICGSGNGVAITANKHANIRAALCWNENIAVLARKHNNANILVLPARFVSVDEAINMINIFLKEPFEGGRHADRIAKINC